MVRVRQDLHAHPEPGFEEHRTAGIIASMLNNLGLEPQTEVAGTGEVGLLRGASPGKTVALRADMDALPVQEHNDLAYRSSRDGWMHACGHDGHVAVLLGAATVLAGLQDSIKGNIKFIFQPAEEELTGARALVEAGVLDDPKVEAIFALHSWPNFGVGEIGFRSGPTLASSDRFELTVRGKGGHGAMPHKTVDPVVAASHIVVALQTVVSRETPADEPVVFTIGQIQGGTAYNVIPEEVRLAGTVRCLVDQIRKEMPKRIERIAQNVAQSMRASAELKYSFDYPVTVNDPKMAALLEKTARAVLGGGNVVVLPKPIMGAEDFAFYLQKVPGAFFFLGMGQAASVHNPHFNFNDEALPVGIEIMCEIALAFLGEGST